MVKIGIVGSDNSHAIQFSQLANLPEGIDGLKIKEAEVVAIWGAERKRTEEVARVGNIPQIVSYPEDMIGKVDAVMVVLRDGSTHYQFSKPFIEANIPTFIDKPLECLLENARRIIELAKKQGSLITSFSTLRYAETTVKLKEELKDKGPITAGHVVGPADLKSEYGGIFFYGIHTTELCQEVFERGAQSLVAYNQHNNVMVIVRYPDEKIVNLSFLGNASYVFQVFAYGKKGNAHCTLGSQANHYRGMKKFLQMIATKEMPFTFEDLLEPVVMLEAIKASLYSGKEVFLKDF